MSERPAVEFLPAPRRGRRFSAERSVRLGDVDPAGELRFDAVASYLQDVASDDAVDACVGNAWGWLVRRTTIRVDHPGQLGEPLAFSTWCSGTGRSWAERRTSIVGERGAAIEAVSLWVQIDTATGRPARLGDDFFGAWGEAAGERTVSSKLSLPAPPAGAASSPWTFRAADLDRFAHVNNAAHWAVVEEMIQRNAVARRGLVAEIEHLAPVPAATPLALRVTDGHAWLTDDARAVTAIAWRSVATPL